MILKKITLNNIRSYESVEVEFSSGSTLLSGNIGSGKTSILLGIEFGLFGLQPGQKGSSILKNGQKTGGVILEFEIGDKSVLVERTLKRAKTISQDYCAITVDGEKRELSVTEIKSMILKLLNYPSELSKKQNLLYKFTVYTPQEEMKQIILEDSETRLNTLRQVFGIDKYKLILENTGILTAKLREEKRIKEGITLSLEQDKVNIKNKQAELDRKKIDLFSIKNTLEGKEQKRKGVLEELEGVSKKREEKIKLTQEIDKSKMMVEAKRQSLIDNKKLESQLIEQIKEISDMQFSEDNIKFTEEEIEKLKRQREELEEHNLDITTRMQALSIKNEDNEGVRKKLSSIEVCPTCLQDVSDNYKSNVLDKLAGNDEKNVSDIKSLALEKQKISQNSKGIEEKIVVANKKLQTLNLVKIRLTDIESKQKRIAEIRQLNETLEKDKTLLTEHLESLNSDIFDLGKFEMVYETKSKELEEASRDERRAEIIYAELKKEIEMFSTQIDEDKERISRVEKIKTQLTRIAEIEDWLNKQFVPLITNIEKNVMAKLKQEFSKTFSEWFSMLVEDNFSVRLSDDFTPIIEQQDYEIDYSYLSGGERTAVALAYRLALNQVINSMMSKINTKDLVILDEPTDGFSEAQLDKMRDVLQELNTDQLIIVSHEQKIEGFVDNVIKFKKVDGLSKKDE